MAYNEELAQRVRAFLADLRLPTEEKRMMGGLCFMVRGKMCVGVTDDRLMVRLDSALMPIALQRPGCTPMAFTGRPLKGFVFVSPTGWRAAADFNSWLQLAIDFNPHAKSSKDRRRKTAVAASASTRATKRSGETK